MPQVFTAQWILEQGMREGRAEPKKGMRARLHARPRTRPRTRLHAWVQTCPHPHTSFSRQHLTSATRVHSCANRPNAEARRLSGHTSAHVERHIRFQQFGFWGILVCGSLAAYQSARLRTRLRARLRARLYIRPHRCPNRPVWRPFERHICF